MKIKVAMAAMMLLLVAVLFCACMHEHEFGAWTTVKPATCTESGLKMKTCLTCEYEETMPLSATGHTPVTDAAREATCKTPGKTQGSHCSKCNVVLTKQMMIPTKEHQEVTDPQLPATCSRAGKTQGSHCSVCGTVLKAQTTIPVKAHTENSEGFCSLCGYDMILEGIKNGFEISFPTGVSRSSVRLTYYNASRYDIELCAADGLVFAIFDNGTMTYNHEGTQALVVKSGKVLTLTHHSSISDAILGTSDGERFYIGLYDELNIFVTVKGIKVLCIFNDSGIAGIMRMVSDETR